MTAFCTTEAPGNLILPYTDRAPYLSFIWSIGFCVGGLIAGSSIVFLISGAKAEWFRKVRTPIRHYPSGPICFIEVTDGDAKQIMMSSPFRIWRTIIGLSLPYIAAVVSTSTALVGKCLRTGSRCGGIELGLFWRFAHRLLVFGDPVRQDFFLFILHSCCGVFGWSVLDVGRGVGDRGGAGVELCLMPLLTVSAGSEALMTGFRC